MFSSIISLVLSFMNLGFVSEVNLPLENTNTLVSQETLIIDNQKTDDSYIVEKTDLNH